MGCLSNLRRSKTVIYTKRKHFLEASIRKRFSDEMVKLEAIPQDMMTAQRHNRYRTLQESLKGYEEKEIEGYRTRTRGLPKYEMHETNIEFFAKLEKRQAKNTVIVEPQDIDGSVYSDRDNLLRITAKFYTQLYTSSPINRQTQYTLLQNVDRQISTVQQRMLDAAITEKELQEAVSQLQDEKSPGIDGITAKFYKQFWYLIHTSTLNTSQKSGGLHYRLVRIPLSLPLCTKIPAM